MDMMPTILVIEDDQGCSELIAEIVQGLGFAVSLHDRASQALALIRAQRPDVLVLDIMLPDGDGLAVLQEIRRDPALYDLPVLLCTAALFELTGRQKPVDDPRTELMLKPFHIEDFVWALTRLLEAR
ncbi:MAG TPA: response regulator [Chloroflexota bacterium]|nr:response regulator [Chloroflexota bacterium]